jgi:hypothetical protein
MLKDVTAREAIQFSGALPEKMGFREKDAGD